MINKSLAINYKQIIKCILLFKCLGHLIMLILFNCTTNNIGGGLKNSVQFIKYASTQTDLNVSFIFAVSEEVKMMLNKMKIKVGSSIYVFKKPSTSLSSRKKLKKLCNELAVDIVYTMAGPAYINFDCVHVMGISNPYLFQGTWKEKLYGKNFLQKLYLIFSLFMQRKYLKCANFFLFQTEFSRQAFLRKTSLPKKNTFVVPNAFDTLFSNNEDNLPINTSLIKILAPSIGYSHKALDLLPKLSSFLSKLGVSHKFIVTEDQKSPMGTKIKNECHRWGAKNEFDLIGHLNYLDLVRCYKECHAVVLPSVLETFSATILEAFVSRRCLIINDQPFNREVAGNGALYFNIDDLEKSASKIKLFFDDGKKQQEKISSGLKQLQNFFDHKNRFLKILETLKYIKTTY